MMSAVRLRRRRIGLGQPRDAMAELATWPQFSPSQSPGGGSAAAGGGESGVVPDLRIQDRLEQPL